MAVKIGSARSDEHGRAYGGAAGDQTGREVSTQNWYRHSKGWRVFRAKDAGAAQKLAHAMEAACANANIGYDQHQRDTLLRATASRGYDPAQADEPVETDCSALVRVCAAYAFGTDVIGAVLGGKRFSTANEPEMLRRTGRFTELTGSRYCSGSLFLRRGDILCTAKQGHTVIVLTDGEGTESATLKRGSKGAAVTALQTALLGIDAACLPVYGADGDFGTETERAVKEFQRASGLTADGIYGPLTRAALEEE